MAGEKINITVCHGDELNVEFGRTYECATLDELEEQLTAERELTQNNLREQMSREMDEIESDRQQGGSGSWRDAAEKVIRDREPLIGFGLW